MNKTGKMSTATLTLGAVLTALVVVLQLMGSFIRFGQFSISLVLVPIVLGAALCGPYVAGWLGFVFGVAVLLSGDAAAFLTVNVIGTIVTVLLKGAACGFAAGLTYRLLENKNRYVAVMAAAIVCPIVNTGIFLIGCSMFFMETISGWAAAMGFGADVTGYMFLGLAGGNFLFELAVNTVLAPVIVKLINIRKKA